MYAPSSRPTHTTPPSIFCELDCVRHNEAHSMSLTGLWSVPLFRDQVQGYPHAPVSHFPWDVLCLLSRALVLYTTVIASSTEHSAACREARAPNRSGAIQPCIDHTMRCFEAGFQHRYSNVYFFMLYLQHKVQCVYEIIGRNPAGHGSRMKVYDNGRSCLSCC